MVRWKVHSERRIYDSPWVAVALTTVEPPGIEPFEHHVIRAPGPAAGCVVTRSGASGQEVLLLFRHRFITDTWGWEIPAGGVDHGEIPLEAAVREAEEETGWRPSGPPIPITTFHPSNGLSDQTFHIFHCNGAIHIGEPTDPSEASRIEWRPVAEVLDLIRSGEVTDGLSLTALAMAFTTGVLTSH
jgi:8-oxo-dGTP pyrophosphatase MutT (NUDIX family)